MAVLRIHTPIERYYKTFDSDLLLYKWLIEHHFEREITTPRVSGIPNMVNSDEVFKNKSCYASAFIVTRLDPTLPFLRTIKAGETYTSTEVAGG